MRRSLIEENIANINTVGLLSYNNTDVEIVIHEAIISKMVREKRPTKVKEKDRKVTEVEAKGKT